MHGGTLHAASEGLGQGSEFILILPVVLQDASLASTRSPPATLARPPKKILVVDDNVDAADTLRTLLGMDGFDVAAVYDGVSAVDTSAYIRPDVVVLDIGMPGMDGYDAARAIRQQPGGEKVVLIALTGWGQTTDRQRASRAGFDHHLVKPVEYDLLMACLQEQGIESGPA